MPCSSAYMDPRPDEAYRQLTAQLLVFAHKELGIASKPSLIVDATNIYLDVDYTDKLCWLIKSMSPAQREQVVYNGRNPMSRKLADWWEKHQENDRKRQQEETDAKLERLMPQYGCPLCKSRDIQACLDYNNPIKDYYKCRDCTCTAPREAWNRFQR